jgi:hypothetical protein
MTEIKSPHKMQVQKIEAFGERLFRGAPRGRNLRKSLSRVQRQALVSLAPT